MSSTVRSTLSTATGRRRLGQLAGALLAGSLVLSACSGGDSSGSASASSTSVAAEATFNTADVMFAQMMIPHHQQAIEMAQLTADRSTNPEVLDLAARIEAAQGPEIEQLTGWLEDWGQDTASASMDMGDMDMGGDMGGMDMGGMMSSEDMASLEAASGTEFDRMWLEMMIEHHTGAIGMAETEISDGEDQGAVSMAEDIKSSQNQEINEMEQLLQSLPQS